MLDELLDLLFPRRAMRDPMGYWMSNEDWNSIPLSPYCEKKDALLDRGMYSLDRLVSACRYSESKLLQRAIHTLKYRNVPALSYKLSQHLLRAVEEFVHSDVTLVPVPLHVSRMFERGFNQSDLLARHVATTTQLPLRHILFRRRSTGHQAWRAREQRLISVDEAFTVYPLVRVPHAVTLIDDITATGATLDACAAALKSAGVTSVDAWVIARA